MLIAHNGAIFIYLRVWSIVVIGIRVLPQPSVRITNISTLSFLQLCLLGDGKCLTLFIMKRIVLLSFCVMALVGCEKESPKLSAHLQSSVFKLSKDLIDSIHEEGIVAYTS